MAIQPVRYDASVEVPAPDEPETVASIIEAMGDIVETTYKDGGHGLRSVHAKSHGLLQGTLTVLDNLPPAYAQGLFATPGRHDAILRISTNPGDILDDSVSTPRGLAIKIFGVKGERLSGSEGATTQDFVLVDGPAFTVSTPKKFAASLKLLAATTDRAQGFKKLFSAAARGIESALESVGTESPTLKSLGGQAETHPLGETFYSQVPIRYGEFIGKVSVAPLSPTLSALTDAPLDLGDKPNGLREVVSSFFADTGAEWEVRVQLCTDLATMPIEDASVVWPETASPYVAVARLTAPPQLTWSVARAKAVDDAMSFTPWHGLAAHRPLGGVMRVRQPVYAAIATLRGRLNGCPMHEPRIAGRLPV